MYVNERHRIESASQNPRGREERSLAKLELVIIVSTFDIFSFQMSLIFTEFFIYN